MKKLDSLKKNTIVDKDDLSFTIEEKTKVIKEEINQEIDYLVDRLQTELSQKIEVLTDSIDEEVEVIKNTIDEVQALSHDDSESLTKIVLNLKKRVEDMSYASPEHVSKSEEKMMKSLKDSVGSIERSIKEARKDMEGKHATTTIEYKNSLTDIHNRFKTFEEIVGKIPKDIFEFGSQLSVLNNGVFKVMASMINFKNGTNTTVVTKADGLGIDVQINATGGGGGVGAWTQFTLNGGTTYAVSSKPTDVNSDGIILFNQNGYTYNSGAGTITFTNLPQQFAGWR